MTRHLKLRTGIGAEEWNRLEEKNRELAAAVAEAERANSSKSRFLAQTSHEIRTPLNIIIGLTEIARDEADDKEKVKDYLQKIEDSSRVLLSLINDILDMSAIEGGKIMLEQKRFDLKKMVTDLAVMYYEQARKKDIHFDVLVKGVTEENLVGDQLRVNQILLNFLSNAVKFTPAGGKVQLQVIQASTSRERVHMRFVVKDSGCGMSEDMLKRLFQPFEQENASTARKHGGSGLGMAITKNLIDMMGGTIHVNSHLNEGTEFIADIPFGRAEQSEKQKLKHDFADFKALIVADTEERCRERGDVLADMGLDYDFVTDGENALDRIGEAEDAGNPYRICVVDWRLKGMTGEELVREIRSVFGDELVIIGASYDLNTALKEGKEAGANYMVGKPVFRSTLFDAMMYIMEGKVHSYEEEKNSAHYDFSGKRILLAEDVALNMEVAVKLLHKVKAEVFCVEDGLQAVRAFTGKPEGFFDCILLDVNMPVMDGYEAARKIRSGGQRDAKTIPIYAMTANAFTSDVAEALDSGMDGHIAKPIETDVLYGTLQQVFFGEKTE